MLLSNYDVKQKLVILMNDFFDERPNFTILKSLLIEQKPIASIHNNIEQEIRSLAEDEKIRKRQNLEQKYLAVQLNEDQQEQDNRPKEIKRLAEEKIHLTIEENRLAIEQFHLLQKQYDLKEELKKQHIRIQSHPAHVTVTPSAPVVHHHDSNRIHSPDTPHHRGVSNTHGHSTNNVSNTHHHNAAAKTTTRFADPIQLLNLQIALEQSEIKSTTTKQRMQAIDHRLNAITQATNERAARGIARAQGAIENSLSKRNQELLKNETSTIDSELNKKAQVLINEANAVNYAVFIEQLEGRLHTLDLLEEENAALTTIFDLMKQYYTQRSLERTMDQKLSLLEKELKSKESAHQQLVANVKRLTNSLPELDTRIQNLEEERDKEQQFLQSNTATRNILSGTTLILAGITLIASIPLLLTVSSIMTLITPAVFASMFFIAPAILLTATIATSLAVLAYAIKETINSSTIAATTTAISEAEHQKNSNQAEMNDIKAKNSICICSEEINTLKLDIERTREERDSTHRQAAATLKSAKETIPAATSSNTNHRGKHVFFSTLRTADTVSSDSNVIYLHPSQVRVIPEHSNHCDEDNNLSKAPSAPSFK